MKQATPVGLGMTTATVTDTITPSELRVSAQASQLKPCFGNESAEQNSGGSRGSAAACETNRETAVSWVPSSRLQPGKDWAISCCTGCKRYGFAEAQDMVKPCP